MKIIILLMLLSISTQASTAVNEAVKAAEIKRTDSLEVKVDKTLRLLNEERYFNPKTSYSKWAGHPYELDSMRSPEQILGQKIGGSCGSSALAFAAILNVSGLEMKKIRIVAAVVNDDLALICPNPGQPRSNSYKSASGHVFVALEFPNKTWQIIDSIGGSRNYARAPWFPPREVERLVKKGLQVPRAVFKDLPVETYGSGLTVFQSWKLDQVPLHTWEQRFDLIATGKISADSSICRFTAPNN